MPATALCRLWALGPWPRRWGCHSIRWPSKAIRRCWRSCSAAIWTSLRRPLPRSRAKVCVCWRCCPPGATPYSPRPHPLLPEAPSLADLGSPAVPPGLNGLFAPAATPPATLARIQGLCQKVVASDGFRQAALGLNQVPAYLDAAQFKARILRTYQANAELLPHLDLERH